MPWASWPASLRFQTTAIIVASFLLSHAAGLLFYNLDRRGALEMTEAVDLAERATGLARLVRELPSDWRASLVRSSDSRAFRVWVSPAPAVDMRGSDEAELAIDAYLRTQVPSATDQDVRVRLVEEGEARGLAPAFDPSSRVGSPPWVGAAPPEAPGIAISIRHDSDEWINFLAPISTPRSLVPELFLANVVSAALGIALVAFWLVSRVTAPLRRLASAAETLGRNLFAEPLPVGGPSEVAVAAAAFNRMQGRLARLIQGRTELLAAISHDLRTPLTQLRLRLEMKPETPEREKNLRALDDMDAIVGTFLAYARASHESEDRSRIDLGALVATVCDDLADLGAAVDCDSPGGLVVACKRLAIRRAVGNLIDNALKYGHEARVATRREGGYAVVAIEDSGPGIPEVDIEAVLQPFRRVEVQPGSVEGGVGLGLSIAQAIAEDHGGEVRLANRVTGGLRAELVLPL
jgi:signal transduction histidine kinase